MTLAFELYDQINEAPDDRTRFRLLVDAIRALEERWPQPADIARGADVRESELRLQKEIEVVRKEMKEAELRLQGEIEGVRKEIEGVRKEIEVVRKEMKEVELRIQGEIELVRKEIKEVELRLQKEIDQVRVDLKSTEANLRTAIHRQTIWIIGAIGAVTGLIRLLDWLLA
ncbi:hypothetical protein CKO31_14370 [Thiohalocapsa halophila]|uniref:DUF1640 domain-containing protein n=1 Tax=Thiohalocapsa halophila TaxID=69359 RepID=A0ABS1CJ15_9GAMM|nr:DUF1640 domain-containing protein [Thiohalocapsa halophila]MBK1631897.1 hypothetical protein [Thiohalocapsa halophila]